MNGTFDAPQNDADRPTVTHLWAGAERVAQQG